MESQDARTRSVMVGLFLDDILGRLLKVNLMKNLAVSRRVC